MKRIAFAAVALAVALWIAAVLLSKGAAKSDQPPDVRLHYPPLVLSSGARRLSELNVGLELPRSVDLPWRQYVDAQLSRADDRTLPPPPDIAVYFGNHAVALDAVRAHLLSAQALTWPELVNLNEHLLMTRIFAAHALAHHDWRDLEAAWQLDRGLWDRPDSLSCIVALTGMRLINGAARKLPPPVPPWFGEILTFDVRRGMLEGQLAELDTIRRSAEDAARTSDSKHDLVSWLRQPFDLAVARNFETVMRDAATSVARSGECGMDVRVFERQIRAAMPWWNRPGFIAVPNLGAMWQRVGRFRAEREATAKILEIKSGRTPSPSSQCSDGTWIVTPGHIRFSKRIEGQIPLEY